MNSGDLDSGTGGVPGTRAVAPKLARLTGLAGIGFAITGAVTWLVAPIAMPETATQVAQHYDANRTALIATSVVVVGGSALLAAWYVALAALLSETEQGRLLGRIGVVGMAIQIAALSVAFTTFAAVAYRQPSGETAQIATNFGWLLVNLAGGPVTAVAVVCFGLALSREGLGGGWLMRLSIVTAFAHLVVACAFAEDGFLSPVGGVAIVVPLVYQTWIGAVGTALARGR